MALGRCLFPGVSSCIRFAALGWVVVFSGLAFVLRLGLYSRKACFQNVSLIVLSLPGGFTPLARKELRL